MQEPHRTDRSGPLRHHHASATDRITANNKVYNANDAAVIASRSLAGVLGTDDVSYAGGTALFSDKNVANAKTVTGTGLGLAGIDAGNYTVNITPAPLTVTASDATKTYGQTPALSLFTTAGLVNGETVGSVTEIEADPVCFPLRT